MKSFTYRISAYLIAALLGVSFYYTLFKLIVGNPVIGIAMASSIILMATFLVLERDAVVLEEA